MAADGAGGSASLFSTEPLSSQTEVVAFRYCAYDVPFWVRSNTRPGRWHRVGDPPTQYWSTTPDGAWAELIRAEDLTTEDELDLLRMPMWVCRAPTMGLLDLTDRAAAEGFELGDEALVSDEWAPCQEAAAQIRGEGHRGVLCPNAALPDTLNVTLFGPRRAIALQSKPRLASAVPSAIVAIGRPRPGLIDEVKRRLNYPDPTLF